MVETPKDPIKKPAPKLDDVVADFANAVSGGQDASLDDLKPMDVTPETEAAFKAAQKKKAEAESDDGGNGGYG